MSDPRFSAAFFVCLLLCATSLARDDWWLSDWPYRQIVEVTTPDPSGEINTALVVVDTDGKCFHEAGDIRVIEAETGRPVKYNVLSGRDGIAHVEFLVSDAASTRYHAYYGNPEAPRETLEWERKVGGLTLATYVNSRRQNAQSWQHMQELLRASSWKYGEGPRKQIFDVDNPFGPDDHYLSVYKGKIYCREDGVYLFATNSDDSSFLLINGKVIAQWPGGHDPLNDFVERDGLAGNVRLTRGIHSIEYYHVETVGAQLAKAGWRPPGETRIRTIPEDAFVRELRTEILARESRDGALDAFFTYRQREEFQFTTLETSFVRVAFRSRATSRMAEPALWWWEFGDGATSRERDPEHEYLEEGEYEVKHYVLDGYGYRDTCVRKVSVKAVEPTRIEPFLEVQTEEPILQPSQPVQLTLKARCTGSDRWPCSLVVEMRTPRERTIDRKTIDVQLSDHQWHTVNEKVQVASRICAIRFRLEYRGVPLLERSLHVVPAESEGRSLRVVNDGLVNERGETVLLRLGEDIVSLPSATFRTRLTDPAGKPRLTVCVVDDSLAPLRDAEKYTYYGVLRERLQAEYPEREIAMARVGGGRAAHYDPLARIGRLPAEVAEISPDLVLVAGSMHDLMNYVPPARYERYLYALVDRLRGVTDAEIALITLPPIIRNPELSKEYARSATRVGLRRGLKVADVYSAFTRDGEQAAWEKFFRDPREPNVFYMQPNRDGQRIIADRILKTLLND